MAEPLRRFFVPPGSLRARHVTLGPDLAHRLGRVLRLRRGDHVVLTEGGTREYEVQITAVSANALTATVVTERAPPAEPDVHLTLFQSLIRANRFDLVLEKGVEIGVSRFVPIVSTRSVVQDNPDGPVAGGEASSARSERWRRLVLEAAEQCGRGRLPQVTAPQQFEDALRSATGVKLIPWEEQRGGGLVPYLRSLRERPRYVSVFIGPEGGFEASEVEQAREAGCTPVTLGPRIMRSETAGIVASALVLATLGDMG
jgi:16S rRNA (uracil1498-N3)-methyltransferase